MALTQIRNNKCFGGYQKTCILKSRKLLCETQFAIYLPPQAEKKKVPVLYWLNNLGSDQETFFKLAGAQRYAAQHGICIVCPDTSPRNVTVNSLYKDECIGNGAGFYVDARKRPWARHYKMFSYVTEELIDIVNKYFPVNADKLSIAGFSMGGHGALVAALKNPYLYASVSAIEPIASPINSPLTQKAYTAYFGESSKGYWHEWDATELVKSYCYDPIEIFIDQSTDGCLYLDDILLPEYLYDAISDNKRIKIILKKRSGYSHDYFYVASAMKDHIEYHSKFLNAKE